MEKFFERLNKLISDVSGGNVTDFAKKSGIEQPTMHKYARGRYPNAESLNAICINLKVNINWLLTGRGDPYIKDAGESGGLVADEDPEIAELLEGARKVLKSGNKVAFDALERNIRYFSLAIETDKRLQSLESRVDQMEKERETVGRKDIKEEELKKSVGT